VTLQKPLESTGNDGSRYTTEIEDVRLCAFNGPEGGQKEVDLQSPASESTPFILIRIRISSGPWTTVSEIATKDGNRFFHTRQSWYNAWRAGYEVSITHKIFEPDSDLKQRIVAKVKEFLKELNS